VGERPSDWPEELDEFTLEGRTALVTGASRGIGAEVAQWLAVSGARVALVARTRSALEEVADRIGNEAVVVEADLSSESGASAAAVKVHRTFGGAPDILVNNAGVFQLVELERTTVEDYAAALRTNLLAPFVFVRAFLSDMRQRGSGHIVTIGSVADRKIFAGNGAYAATKFGARAMHEVLREETRGSGVRATLVSPAGVNTDIWNPIRFPGQSEPPDRSVMLDPGAVANAVLFALMQPPDVNIDELRLSRS
jgi:NADP-dependent 3-hydroxy acid dehydrogenase YdfG